MPKKRSVPPLERLCLDNVAGNMQHVWAKDYTDNYLDEYHFRYIMGPFSELAGSLVQELLQLLGKTRRLTRPMLHLLLVPQLTELNLSTCPKLVSNAIVQIVTMRCKTLSSLDLQGCSRVPADALVDLLEGLPSLTRLDLSRTQCTTQVLSAVGSCCRRLRELDVSDCQRLSPASLLHLAYDPTVGSFCCPALQVLSVDGLEAGSGHSQDLVPALAFLLAALPSLQCLLHDLAAEAVCLIHSQEFHRAQISPGFPSLEELVQRRASSSHSGLTLPLRHMAEVREPFLPALCAVCPHVAEVTVFLEEGPSLSQSLLAWKQLTRLMVNCMAQRDLRELLPVATSLGAQLQVLSLGGFSLEDELSFPALLSRCPNLRELHLSLLAPVEHGRSRAPAAEASSFRLSGQHFPRLHDLGLILCGPGDALPPQHTAVLRESLVSLLQHSPGLERLNLDLLPFSLDEVFEKVLSGGPGAALACLRELSLSQGKVSTRTIRQLLASDNQLSLLNLDGCPDIHRRDYDELLRTVSREGLELNIVWA